MRFSRLSFVLAVALFVGALATGFLATGGLANLAGIKASAQPTPEHPVAAPQPFPDAYKVANASLPNIAVPGAADGLTHPCGGMSPTPPYTGVSPLAIAYVPSMCGGYGDIAVWQANGHSYVAQSGWTARMYHIWNVDDPYAPVLQYTKTFPSGGNTSKAIFHFHQYGHEYLATAMGGTGVGCGYFIDNVDNPASPVAVVTNKRGTDWCTVHETFVSTNAGGDADYAWLTMSGESGSGLKVVALTLPDLSQSNVLTETGRYQRPDSIGGANGGIFNHDSNVVGDRVYLAHWQGGVVVLDKETLAHNIQPTPLSIDTLKPSNFWVHHTVPTSDNKFIILQDEFINSSSLEKIKIYNMENLAAPFYAGGIIGGDTESNRSQAHNQIIKNLGPHHDLLLSAFYLAGYRLYDLDTSGTTPVITQVGSHQLRATGGPNFGGVWGVDQLPCTVRGIQTTCIYSSDMTYGLVVDALGVNPALDPYLPDPSVISSPSAGQQIDTCTFTIQGTAPQDYWSGLARIQVSTNGGATWVDATGTTSWSYQWNIVGTGAFTIMVRAVDNAGNTQANPTIVNVNVTANCPLLTPTPGPSSTPVPTNSPVPPTSTSVPPTNTAIPPTGTSVPPTNTSVPPTSTSVPPTSTRTSTSIPPTSTPPLCTGDSPLCTPTAIVTATRTATATATACTISFSDVPVGSTFYTYIQCLACRGIISGYGDGTFRPNNNITRGQLAKIVSQAAGLSGPAGAQIFEDVAPGSTFYDYVQRLATPGYMSGYPCGGAGEPCGSGNRPYFRPGNNATRGQISKIVSNAAGLTRIPAGGQTFEDVPPSHTFYQYIEMLAGQGVMNGYPCGGAGEPCGSGNRPYFRPGNNATRGQVSKIVANTFFPECSAR